MLAYNLTRVMNIIGVKATDGGNAGIIAGCMNLFSKPEDTQNGS